MRGNILRRGASIVLVEDDQVLMVERGKPPFENCWSFPGGAIEPGETARMAALRELEEETGLAGDVVTKLGIIELSVSCGAAWRLEVFSGRVMGGQLQALGDARSVRWLDAAQRALLPMTDEAERLAHTAITLHASLDRARFGR